jgi:citrate lyase subunit alpha/citrate CoA-transferase
VTPGTQIDVLVTDHGIAVNPNREEVQARLINAGIPIMDIHELQQRAESLTGKPKPIEYLNNVVGYVRYRDGSVIDVIRQVKE